MNIRAFLQGVALLSAVLCVATTPALAATVNVTSTADTGAGSLRSVLASAANGDTINAGGVSGTILLTSGELVVSNNVTILGPGPAILAVNGNGSSRVFRIPPSRNVTIAGLTITNGYALGSDYPDGAGGGIYNERSILTVSNCVLRGNFGSYDAGAIYNYSYSSGLARLVLVSCTISDNSTDSRGGGVHNVTESSGTAIVTANDCIFSRNSAKPNTAGGAIFSRGNDSGSVTVTLSNCTITNNSVLGFTGRGGGIYSLGDDGGNATLTVLNCTVMGNSAADIGGGIVNECASANSSALTRVFNSVVSSNSGYDGGGIANYAPFSGIATLVVTNCTITANSSSNGAAIWNKGDGKATASLLVSTISSNLAVISGGGIFSEGEITGETTLTVTNCTFSGNSASNGGAIYASGAFSSGPQVATVVNTTFSGNSATKGDSIYNSATLQIGSTILTGTSGTNLYRASGTVTSLGYNLTSDNGGGWLTNTADQINTNPWLGPLQNNGGPTFTHAPLPGSPAMDKGKNLSGSAKDQRGFARVVDLCPPNAAGGDDSDIGAVEFSGTIPTGTLTVDNLNDFGPGSLRDAILIANSCPDANTIEFAPSAFGTILLTSGELPITGPLDILGPGPTNAIINGNGSSRVFRIAPANTVTIAGLTITNGLAVNSPGGGIYNDHASLTVSNCTIAGNSASDIVGAGGGIASNGESGSASLTVIASTLSGNHASAGGAILNEGSSSGSATATVLASTLSGNGSTSGSGGAIFNSGQVSGSASLFIGASTLSSNSAGVGGCIYSTGSAGSALVSLNSVTFSGNMATVAGATIYNDSLFSANTIVRLGNTILNSSAPAHIANIENSQGVVISHGYNLSSDNGNGFLTNATDQINTNPQLGALQNNGGPTFTHALLAGSPAIDRGKRDAIASLATDADQRGLLRPVDSATIANALGGDGSDIGAFEVQAAAAATPMVLVSPQKVLNGPFQFSFTNTPGASFTVLTSTNIALPLSNWTVLGAPTETSPGNFQFADPQATNRPQRFYAVRSP